MFPDLGDTDAALNTQNCLEKVVNVTSSVLGELSRDSLVQLSTLLQQRVPSAAASRVHRSERRCLHPHQVGNSAQFLKNLFFPHLVVFASDT